MRLLIDARTMGSKPSGIGVYVFDFLKELIKDPSIQIVLLSDVATSSEMRYCAEHDIEIVTYGHTVYQSGGVFRYFRFVQQCLDRYHPDVFWEPNNLIPVRLRRFHGKIVVTIHDVFPISAPESFGKVYPLYFRMGLRRTLAQVDGITYNSKETKREVEKYFPNAQYIENLVSYIIVNPPNKPEEKLLLKTHFSDNTLTQEPYMLYVGNLEKRKGTDLLLKAYEKYCKDGGTKQLLLAGKIPEEEIERQLNEAVSKFPGVQYLGYVDDQQKAALYAGCSCFVFPSRAEGFGIPLIEAMYHNCPILASRLPIFEEIVGDTISFYELVQEEEKQVCILAEAMQQEHKVKHEGYQEVIQRYTSETLGKKFVQFMKRR